MNKDEVSAASPQMMPITDKEFEAIRKLVYERFGITLNDQKRGLVVGRLQKILRENNYPNFQAYYDYLVHDKTNQAISVLANQITTNHTFFYREPEHFAFFKQTIIPEAMQRHKQKGDTDLRFWCAAASSGEEPYTIIIEMMELLGVEYSKWDIGLLCTDISEKALTAAKQAVYDTTRLQGVPPAILQKYFKQTAEGHWAVIDKVKKEAIIRRFNLMNQQLPFKKPFDCIWCRNVMIYFDNETKIDLVNRMYKQTVNGGYLLIGHSETLGRGQTPWKYIRPAVYKKEE